MSMIFQSQNNWIIRGAGLQAQKVPLCPRSKEPCSRMRMITDPVHLDPDRIPTEAINKIRFPPHEQNTKQENSTYHGITIVTSQQVVIVSVLSRHHSKPTRGTPGKVLAGTR